MKCLLPALAFLALLSGPAAAETYGAWTIRCAGQGTDRQCEAFQRLTRAETGERVLELAISFATPAQDRGPHIAPPAVASAPMRDARAVIVLPLGLFLPDGVFLNVDKGPRHAFQLRYCLADGCYAQLAIPRSLQEQMGRSLAASITFRTLDGEDVELPLDPRGLTSALQAIR